MFAGRNIQRFCQPKAYVLIAVHFELPAPAIKAETLRLPLTVFTTDSDDGTGIAQPDVAKRFANDQNLVIGQPLCQIRIVLGPADEHDSLASAIGANGIGESRYFALGIR